MKKGHMQAEKLDRNWRRALDKKVPGEGRGVGAGHNKPKD